MIYAAAWQTADGKTTIVEKKLALSFTTYKRKHLLKMLLIEGNNGKKDFPKFSHYHS